MSFLLLQVEEEEEEEEDKDDKKRDELWTLTRASQTFLHPVTIIFFFLRFISKFS